MNFSDAIIGFPGKILACLLCRPSRIIAATSFYLLKKEEQYI